MTKYRNISLVWDFDGTLSPDASTSILIDYLTDGKSEEFWDAVHEIVESQKKKKKETPSKLTSKTSSRKTPTSIFASDAPIWMHALSLLAQKKGIFLKKDFFKEKIKTKIKLYKNVLPFLKEIKAQEETEAFKKLGIQIHHFIVSAGLQELVQCFFSEEIIKHIFGCRYDTSLKYDTIDKTDKQSSFPFILSRLTNIPVFCMDETMKTRSLYEINKGIFLEEDEEDTVNKKVEDKDLWSPFSNMIYIGDGPTDIPALSLVRSRGGLGIALTHPKKETEKQEEMEKQEETKEQKEKKKQKETEETEKQKKRDENIEKLRKDKRTDLITVADFSCSKDSVLYNYIKNRCEQIRHKYEAEPILDEPNK